MEWTLGPRPHIIGMARNACYMKQANCLACIQASYGTWITAIHARNIYMKGLHLERSEQQVHEHVNSMKTHKNDMARKLHGVARRPQVMPWHVNHGKHEEME